MTLTPATRPMGSSAAAGMWEIVGFAPVPRVQIVTIETLLTSPASPLRLPLTRSDTYRKAAREEKPDSQGRLDF